MLQQCAGASATVCAVSTEPVTGFGRNVVQPFSPSAYASSYSEQADRACRSDRGQMAVAHAVAPDRVSDILRQRAHELSGEIGSRFKQRKGALLAGQRGRGTVCRMANGTHDAGGK